MTSSEIFKSTIKDKKILLVQPGNTLHTINFTGLNFEETTEYDEVFDLSDYEKFKNTKYDYIFIHGFLGRRIHNHLDINKISEYNISTKEIIIDYLGEGYSIPNEIHFIIDNLNIMFSYNSIKVLSPITSGLDWEIENYKNIDFFNYPMAGPRVFCSPYNFMLHDKEYNNQIFGEELASAKNIFAGLKWSDTLKEFKFMCLNNRKQAHRTFIVSDIVENDLIEHGIVSSREGTNESESYNLYYKDRPFNNQETVNVTHYFIEPSGDVTLDAKFGPNTQFSSKSYIDVVTETSAENLMFVTEKSMKPFFNLQFPLIFGPVGIVQELRNYGFDMFDDIINHDYDKLSFDIKPTSVWYSPIKNAYLFEKSKMICKELKRLLTLDIHQLYIDNKERFLHNQRLVNEICIDNNNLLKDVGIYIFNKNITIEQETEFNKVYI